MCWCHDSPPMEKQKQWANAAACWICISGEKSIDAAKESSNTEGLVPTPHSLFHEYPFSRSFGRRRVLDDRWRTGVMVLGVCSGLFSSSMSPVASGTYGGLPAPNNEVRSGRGRRAEAGAVRHMGASLQRAGVAGAYSRPHACVHAAIQPSPNLWTPFSDPLQPAGTRSH